MSFYKLGIKGDWVYFLQTKDIDQPTPIQQKVIPLALKKQDLLAEAQTGTGKTYAFLLPTLQKIDPSKPYIQALIVAPTRELAIQITEVAKELCEYTDIGIIAVYGGQDVNAQIFKLKSQIHLVIATPGRLLDHSRRGTLELTHIDRLIIDEADQMLHIGFLEEIKSIMKIIPKNRHTMCFTATMSKRVTKFAKDFLNDPIEIKIPKTEPSLDLITQLVIKTSGRKKFEDFKKCLSKEKPEQAMIFCRSRKGAQSLFEEMANAGFIVEALHGDLTQAKREFVMQAFKEKKVQYLVATDVASRGIDVLNLSHVFNYNLPDDPENYIHRIGRTGRAGLKGRAITILTEKDAKRLQVIEEFIGTTITLVSP